MMDLFSNLWGRGGAQGAPTDMSQVKVQQQPMDLSSTFPAAGEQVSYQGAAKGAADNSQMNDVYKGLALGGASAIAGMHGQQQQPGIMAPRYQGGRGPELTSAEALSGTRLSDLQKFAQVGGLMSKSQ